MKTSFNQLYIFFYYHIEDMSINNSYQIGKCLPRGTVIKKVHLYNINEAIGGGMNGGSFNEMQAKNAPANMSLVEGTFWHTHKTEYLWCCAIPFSCNESIDLEGVGAKLASSRLPCHHPWCCCITYEVSDGVGAPIGTIRKGCCSFCCGHDVTNTKEGTTWKVVPNCCHYWCCCFCCKYRIYDANEQEVGVFDRCNYLCFYQKYDVNFSGKMSPTDKLLTMSTIPFLCPVPVSPPI